jgi:hypothetical protein
VFLADRRFSLYETGEFSDAAVHCDDKTFMIHRAIVCLLSGYFQRALGESFEEASTRIVKIEEPFSAELMHMMFRTCYECESDLFRLVINDCALLDIL